MFVVQIPIIMKFLLIRVLYDYENYRFFVTYRGINEYTYGVYNTFDP